MTLVVRARALERDLLERAERISQLTGYADRVIEHLDQVEDAGGPDAPAATFAEALTGAHEEAVDGGAWITVAFSLAGGGYTPTDDHARYEAALLAEEAVASFARAEHLLRGALDILEGGG